MVDLTSRSYQKELLDQDYIPLADLERNLLELDFINTWLGGHAVTIQGLSSLIKDKSKTYTVLDIGSGGGDTLRYVSEWATRKNWKLNLIGLDYKSEAISFAQKHSEGFANISFIESDYRLISSLKLEPDIIISSLFCHHLDNEQIVEFLNLVSKKAKIGFVINDLHRNQWAYYSIKWLTGFFSKSYLVKNDAPLSVWRGFSRADWVSYFETIRIEKVEIKWKWAFRWLIVGRV